TVDFGELATVFLEVHRLAFLGNPALTQLDFLGLALLERGDLILPVKPPEGGNRGHQQADEHGHPRRGGPEPRIVGVEPLEVLRDAREVDAIAHGGSGRGFHFAAPLAPALASAFAAAPPASSLASVSGWRMLMASVNSLTRRLSSIAALASTSDGCSRKGEASMLRIRCETRALDCAYPTSVTRRAFCLMDLRYTPSGMRCASSLNRWTVSARVLCSDSITCLRASISSICSLRRRISAISRSSLVISVLRKVLR